MRGIRGVSCGFTEGGDFNSGSTLNLNLRLKARGGLPAHFRGCDRRRL